MLSIYLTRTSKIQIQSKAYNNLHQENNAEKSYSNIKNNI